MKEIYEEATNQSKMMYEAQKEEIFNNTLKENKKLNQEIERLINIIEKLEERCKFFNEMSNEKQNRIDRCMAYNNYILHENWYGGNEKKYAQRNIDILLGKETELKEIPRLGSDKE